MSYVLMWEISNYILSGVADVKPKITPTKKQ